MPVSLIGTFAVMYLFGYSLDNLSLMALTISTGFVVDDAIVVMENITRHLENGMKPFAAALKGAEEIGFTVFTISISLIAVFIPLLLMGGIVGRLFREFAVTLSTAILVSMIVSLTTTPMMCAYLLKNERTEKHGRIFTASEKFFDWVLSLYRGSLRWVLDHPAPTLVVLFLTIALNVVLIVKIPKGFFPQEDTGAITGAVRGPQDSSFPAMNDSIQQIGARDQERSRRRECDCVYRRQWGHKYRLPLRCAQATGGAQERQCRSDHQPPAPPIEPSAGGFRVPPSRAGSAHRRPVQ